MKSFPFETLASADLIIDAIYQGKRQQRLNLSCEPLTQLIPGIGNMGGFRIKPSLNNDGLAGLVLMSTKNELDWPDEINIYNGTYTYFGDNRKPGQSLHDTPKKGNKYLSEIFAVSKGSRQDRLKVPLILIFESAGFEHDVVFKGLAVPGAKKLQEGEDLVAMWASVGGNRFQNYRAVFTILDCGDISGNWVRSVFSNKYIDLQDTRIPAAFRNWIEKGTYTPLQVDPKTLIRSKKDQLPESILEKELVEMILENTKKDPWKFEIIAKEIWQMHTSQSMEIEITRKWRDGGRDALGKLIIGSELDPIKIDFVLEAKRYDFSNSVGVRELSRLISRIKHRDFGVLITTSYVNSQAYKEVRADNHPIAILSGKDIARTLIKKRINNKTKMEKWLNQFD